MENLSPETWKQQYAAHGRAVILDVRTPQEWEEGIIPGAIQLDIQNPGSFMDGLATLEKDKAYFVYCRAGGRSAQACMILESQGFPETYNLDGGVMAWTDGLVDPQS